MVEITDEMIEALRNAECAGGQIQGFYYKPDHVIRDLRLKPGQQEIWRGGDGEAYCEALRRFKEAEMINAVAPLIEAQARADAIEEAIVALNGIDGPSWHDDGSFGLAMERGEKAIRALLSPRPVSQGAGA